MQPVIKTYAPVIIPTLNRFEHLKRCVESLSKCTHADKTELIIGLDYPAAENHFDGWRKIQDYLPQISGFSKVTVVKREHNYGAEANYLDLVSIVSQTYDCYIFTEDDNEFSTSFLDFINKGLETYKDNPNVFTICGYNYPIDMDGYDKPYYFSHEISAWGFGGWISKFEEANKVIRKPGFLIQMIRNNPLKVFLKNNTRLCSAVYHIGYEVRGDAYMTYYQYLYNKYSVSPTISLVRNHGHDGSGIHCGNNKREDRYLNQIIDGKPYFDSEFNLPIRQEEIIKKKLQKQHFKYSFKTKLKRVTLLLLIRSFANIRDPRKGRQDGK